MRKTTILLTYSNDNSDDDRNLDELEKEQNLIDESLDKIRNEGVCNVIRVNNATTEDLIEKFREEF